jgi:hypothetical protein
MSIHVSYEVIWYPDAAVECGAVHDLSERVAIQHAREKLEVLGPKLAAPHCSAIKGEEGVGLRELRPRAGRSRWRPIYRRIGARLFVILAVAPEAQVDKRGFERAIRDAKQRLGDLRA